MKSLIMSLIGIFLLAGVSTGEPIDNEKMSEDILTMSRLIDGELQKEFRGKYSPGFWGNGGCMGVYLRDYGVVFTKRVRLPIFDYQEVKSEKEPEQGDLWEIYRTSSQSPDIKVSDKQKRVNEIKKIEGFLIDIFCNYSNKITQLSPDEYITIAVQGSSESGRFQFQFVNKSPSKVGDKVDVVKDDVPSYVQSTRTNASETDGQYLVMRIKKKDVGKDCANKIEISYH
ncbi:hypothetical protein ACFL1R_11620 [Candidatus Latescibacterota bacterium]